MSVAFVCLRARSCGVCAREWVCGWPGVGVSVRVVVLMVVVVVDDEPNRTESNRTGLVWSGSDKTATHRVVISCQKGSL